jgi:hypothetical protein
MTFNLNSKTLCVFSHPNHELAVFGLLQKMRPTLAFLTDGGGQHRVNETRKALESIGLGDRAIFLPYTEKSFYDALARADAGFFYGVASEIRTVISSDKPDQILCDAVEYYNPVHDMSLPIVYSANDLDIEKIFEVPLIYQKSGDTESYGIQCAPESQIDKVEVALSKEESASKREALEKTYTILRDTLGKVLLASPRALEVETIFPASSPLRWPDKDRVLRYERRARELMARGEIPVEITHAYHFLLIVSQLTGIANG